VPWNNKWVTRGDNFISMERWPVRHIPMFVEEWGDVSWDFLGDLIALERQWSIATSYPTAQGHQLPMSPRCQQLPTCAVRPAPRVLTCEALCLSSCQAFGANSQSLNCFLPLPATFLLPLSPTPSIHFPSFPSPFLFVFTNAFLCFLDLPESCKSPLLR